MDYSKMNSIKISSNVKNSFIYMYPSWVFTQPSVLSRSITSIVTLLHLKCV